MKAARPIRLAFVAGLCLVPVVEAAFPIQENFDGKNNSSLTAAGWLVNGHATVTGNRVRLTQALNGQLGSVIYNQAFSSSLGINVQFDYFIGLGTGADGMSFFLLDGSVSSPTTGPGSGSLGYTYAGTTPGLSKGYLGVGFDVFGHYLNGFFFGDGVASNSSAPVAPKTIGLRGPGTANPSRQSNNEYHYVPGSAVSFPQISSGTTWRKVNLTLNPNGAISMQISTDNGATWTTIYNNLDFESSSAFTGYTRPAFFKLGFAASTGGLNNEHSIDNLVVSVPVDLAVTFTSSPSGVQAVGAPVSYAITVTNNGPNADAAPTFSYTAPNGLSSVTWTAIGSGGGSASPSSGSGNSIAATLNLPAGAAVTFNVSGTIASSAMGQTLTHTATAAPSSGFGDPSLANNSATVTTTVSGSPILSGLAGAVTFQENTVNAAPQVIDSDITLIDDGRNFDGGNVTVSYSSGGGVEDQLSILHQGSGAGQIRFSGGAVSYAGTPIGTVPASGAGSGINGQSLIVSLNSSATVAATEALIENLTYRNTSDAPAATRTISLTIDDGAGGVSSAQTVAITVNAQNDAPAMTSISALSGAVEDTPFTIPYTALAAAANAFDPDSDPLSFRIETVSSGTLTKGGATVSPGVTLLGSGESLSWTPAANANGLLSAFTVVAYDGVATSASAVQVTVNAAAANDAPSFTKGADQTVLEDAGAQNVANWATNISSGPSDESGQALAFELSNDNNALFSSQPAVASDGTLTYTPASNANGSSTVTVALKDNGGTGNGGSDASATQTFTITVTPVNDAPTLLPIANVSIPEDAINSTGVTLHGITAGGGETQHLRVSVSVSNSGVIAAPEIEYASPSSAGSITLRPVPNAYGTTTVTVIVQDDGGRSNGGVDMTSRSFEVTVLPVNDAPMLDRVGLLDGAIEDTPFEISYDLLRSAVQAQDVDDESLQFRIASLLTGTLTRDGQPIVPGQTLVQAGSTLVWTPPLDANGSVDAFVVRAFDGQLDSALAATVSVSIAPVNDPPNSSALPNLVIDEDGTGIVEFEVSDLETPPDRLFVKASSSDPSLLPDEFLLFAGTGARRRLAVVPTANRHGTAAVTVTVLDDDGLSTNREFLVIVNSLNDPPLLTRVETLKGAVQGIPFTLPYDALLSASDARDVDGDKISFRIDAVLSGAVLVNRTSVEPGVSLLQANQSLVWFPSSEGTMTALTVRAFDGRLNSITTVPVNVEVRSASLPPDHTVPEPASQSADYWIPHQILDSGGGASSSLDYQIDSSFGLFGGVSQSPTAVVAAFPGHAGQISDEAIFPTIAFLDSTNHDESLENGNLTLSLRQTGASGLTTSNRLLSAHTRSADATGSHSAARTVKSFTDQLILSTARLTSDGRLEVRFEGQTDGPYVILRSTNLVTWSPVLTNSFNANSTVLSIAIKSEIAFFRIERIAP